MAIKVLIHRNVRRGHEGEVWELLKEMRSEAVRRRGYMYSETWRSLDHPGRIVVVSAWARRAYWEAWRADDFRITLDARISRLLRGAARVEVLEEVASLPPSD